jgi:hypothetical protein
MGTRRRPRSSWLARMLRVHRLDRNPLRRWSDRAEAAVLGLLAAAFLAGAPFGVHAAGSIANAVSVREQQWTRHTWPCCPRARDLRPYRPVALTAMMVA